MTVDQPQRPESREPTDAQVEAALRETLDLFESVIALGPQHHYGRPPELVTVARGIASRLRKAPALAADSRPADDDLRAAVEIMATKVTPYGERADGTTTAYIVADSTWHRVLAIARRGPR